jgi:hypothetical protein
MSIIDKLSSALGRRDEKPNEELAAQIVAKKDVKAVKELVENLSNSSKDIQSNCIKVLYEVGEQQPELISNYAKNFVGLLDSTNNRMQWGAMTALDSIAALEPKTIYPALGKILEIAEKGSVITRDHAVGILIKLSTQKQYSDKTFPLLIAELRTAPTNQLPMYAENALPIVDEKHRAAFIKTLSSRLDDIEKETKRKRVEKVIQKLSKA